MSFRRLRAISTKECLHIVRDPLTLVIIFVLPLVTMFLFGYAVRLDIKGIKLVVIDLDRTRESRDLISNFQGTPYFNITEIIEHFESSDPLFRERRGTCVLKIPRDFGRTLNSAHPEPVQFVADASDSNTATVAGQYAGLIVEQFYLAQSNSAQPARLNPAQPLVLFNPEFRSTWFIVPGLVAVLFMMICALMTSATIVREKEKGTMEQLLVSPVRPIEIILGKLLPYVGLSALVGTGALLTVTLWFGVPFRGNPLFLAGMSLLYIVCALGFGLLISSRTRSMQVALMVSLITTMLPSVMLSGFMFPIRSMPQPIQWITHIVPARYYLIIIRSIMLKAGTFQTLMKPVCALAIYTVVIFGIGINRFRNSLE